MLFEHELRVRLKERRNRLYKKDWQLFDTELGFFLDWMEKEPYLRSLLAEIEMADITIEAWEPENFGWQKLQFPDSEIKAAKLCIQVCRKREAGDYAYKLAAGNFNEGRRAFVETFVDPLVHYLEDRTEEGSSVLGVLERYKRRTEWFQRKHLFDLYNADTTRGEAHLDAHLREYLVDQGISYPFSQPSSPSGDADIVAGLDSSDPLALEVKVFGGPNNYDDAYVRKGFAQAFRYANDYNLPAGYLVVFNLSDKLLLFETEAKKQWPPTVHLADKTVFLIAVDINPNTPKASKDKSLARSVISEAFLLNELKQRLVPAP
jgi:hypothetical protein